MQAEQHSKRALGEQQVHFALFMEHLPGGAWLKDDSGRYVYVNRYAAERIFARPLRDILGKTDDELLPADQAAQFNLNDRTVIASGQPLQTIETLPRGAEIRHSMVIKFPVLDEQGRVAFVGGTSVDITERKVAEEALQSALLELEKLKTRLQVENVYLQEEIKTQQNVGRIIGQSERLRRLLATVERVAPTDSTVLILGETGTGKELIARAIHELSPRHSRPLIKINCAAIPENLVESELFGHEKGAFSGAAGLRKGRFELADDGTLFLDEIGDMPLLAQTKLLRVLQEQEFERVGGSRPIRVNVRVLAATHRDLKRLVAENRFREDLYYRLNVFPLELPPLRERPEDIVPLTHFFVSRFAQKHGVRIARISDAGLSRLQAYSWPGNVRELENIIERGVILCTGAVLELSQLMLPIELGTVQAKTSPPPELAAEPSSPVLSGTLDEMEHHYILHVLERCHWVIEGEHGAARQLGLKPSTLRNRMQRLGIYKLGSVSDESTEKAAPRLVMAEIKLQRKRFATGCARAGCSWCPRCAPSAGPSHRPQVDSRPFALGVGPGSPDIAPSASAQSPVDRARRHGAPASAE